MNLVAVTNGGPQRTCVGCRTVGPASQMVRLVWDGDRLSLGRTAPGRGAWLHPSVDCLNGAGRKGALSRAFRTVVPLTALEAVRPLVLRAASDVGGELSSVLTD